MKNWIVYFCISFFIIFLFTSFGLADASPQYFYVNQSKFTGIWPGDAIQFYAYWVDDIDLSHYIFSWNSSGTPQNDTPVSFVTSPTWPAFPGWKYRVPITINSTSDLTDYQVLITLDTQSLISAGRMRSDCGDIRFTWYNSTSQTEIEIPYWIESGCNTTSTKIWLKVPEISLGAFLLEKTINISPTDVYGRPQNIRHSWFAPNPKKDFLAIGIHGDNPGDYKIYNITSDTIAKNVTTPNNRGRGSSWSSNASLYSVGGGGNHGWVNIYNTTTWNIEKTIPYQGTYWYDAYPVFLKNDTYIAVGYWNGGIRIYRYSDLAIVKEFNTGAGNGNIVAPRVSQDSNLLATAAAGKVFVFNISSANPADWFSLKNITLEYSAWGETGIDFSPDGSKLAVAETGTVAGTGSIKIFNTTDWSLIKTIPTDSNKRWRNLRFSPNGAILAVSTIDVAVVKIYRTSGWSLYSEYPLNGTNADGGLSFNVDGTILAVPVDRLIRVFRTATIVYMYYGNPSASPKTDITSTFIFGDDFSGTSLNSSKWNLILGRADVSNGLLHLYSPISRGRGEIEANETIFPINVNNTKTEVLIRPYNTQTKSLDGIWFVNATNAVYQNYLGYTNGYWEHRVWTGSSYTQGVQYPSDISWQRAWLTINSSNVSGYYKGETLTRANDQTQFNLYLKVALGDDYEVNTGIYVDWIFIRKYFPQEPTYSIGLEEPFLRPFASSGNLPNLAYAYDKNWDDTTTATGCEHCAGEAIYYFNRTYEKLSFTWQVSCGGWGYCAWVYCKNYTSGAWKEITNVYGISEGKISINLPNICFNSTGNSEIKFYSDGLETFWLYDIYLQKKTYVGGWSNITKTINGADMGKTLGWQIYANDSANNWNFTPIQTFTVETLPSTTLTFYKGWNLISIPNKAIINVTDDPCNISSRKFYYYNATKKAYEAFSLQQLVSGKGYWIYSPSTQTCKVNVTATGLANISDISLKSGYNLIGAPYDSVSITSLSCPTGTTITDGPYYWDATTQKWIGPVSELMPGRGYWLRCS
jgi:hypothetical protein